MCESVCVSECVCMKEREGAVGEGRVQLVCSQDTWVREQMARSSHLGEGAVDAHHMGHRSGARIAHARVREAQGEDG